KQNSEIRQIYCIRQPKVNLKILMLNQKPDYRTHIFHQNSYHNILNYPNIVLIQKKNLIVQNILLWLKKMLKIELNVYLLIIIILYKINLKPDLFLSHKFKPKLQKKTRLFIQNMLKT
ncbi:hypothetical protein BpHYR1_028884, partial [Brachionus plicatilis]